MESHIWLLAIVYHNLRITTVNLEVKFRDGCNYFLSSSIFGIIDSTRILHKSSLRRRCIFWRRMHSFRVWRGHVCKNIPPTSHIAIRRDIPARRTNRRELVNIFLPMLPHAVRSFQKLRNVRRWDFRSSRWLSICTMRHDQRDFCGYYESVHCSIYFWPRWTLFRS